MNDLITVIGIACLINGVVRFDFYKAVLKFFDIDNANKYIQKLFTCEDCLTFWTTLIYTGNLLYAGIGFVVSKIISDYIDGRRFI